MDSINLDLQAAAKLINVLVNTMNENLKMQQYIGMLENALEETKTQLETKTTTRKKTS